MNLLGPQYGADDAFKRIARKHQSAHRANVLNVPYDKYGNMLQEKDAREGLNFYREYGVFDAVKKRYPVYDKQLYANLLRSEHIPFNMFVPFRAESALFASVMAQAVGVNVVAVKSIEVECAPEPASEYLNDKTAFDVFCDCEDATGGKFFLGIEVKYTEREYRMEKKEAKYCSDPQSPYNRITTQTSLYRPEIRDALKTDAFRQVWRNHLLAESIILANKLNYRYYKSIILYPSDNTHISNVVNDYKKLLSDQRAETFAGITFEEFFLLIDRYAESPGAKDWAAYLKRRYIPVKELA